MLSFTIGKSLITVFIDGSIHTVDSSHANFQPLYDELRKPAGERDREAIKTYSTIRQFITRYEGGRIRITDAEVLFDEQPVTNYMTQRMLDIATAGFEIEPWALFMDKVMDNPAEYVRAELYEWLEAGEMPLCPDGDFIAFKKVTAEYRDVRTGLFDNSIGTILEMDREACDPDRENHCSSGFHFCSAGYLSSYPGECVMVLKINPSFVTAIPSDYKFAKGRTCRYEVIGELSSESAARHGVWKKPVAYLEDTAEFPKETIAALQEGYHSGGYVSADAPKLFNPACTYGRTLGEILYDSTTPIKDTRGEFNNLVEDYRYFVEDSCAKIEADQTDAIQTSFDPSVIITKPHVTVTKTPERWHGESYRVSSQDPRITSLPTIARLGIANKAVAEVDRTTIVNVAARDGTRADQEAQETALRKRANNFDTYERHMAAIRGLKEISVEDTPAQVFETTDGRTFSASVVEQALSDASIRGAAKDLGISESTLRGWKKRL